MTTFFAREESGAFVGMVRMRHCLNEALVEHGCHIGYFVRSDRHGHGYGKQILARALLTTDKDNPASIALIDACGGGGPCLRFWIEHGD